MSDIYAGSTVAGVYVGNQLLSGDSNAQLLEIVAGKTVYTFDKPVVDYSLTAENADGFVFDVPRSDGLTHFKGALPKNGGEATFSPTALATKSGNTVTVIATNYTAGSIIATF